MPSATADGRFLHTVRPSWRHPELVTMDLMAMALLIRPSWCAPGKGAGEPFVSVVATAA
jgi:hypothetical protein